MVVKVGDERTKRVTKGRPSKVHLAQLKAAAREEAFVARQRAPSDSGSFSGFLRTGSY